MNASLSDEKKRILNTTDLYSIIQTMLIREYDKKKTEASFSKEEQKYFWVIGLAADEQILFIELIKSKEEQGFKLEPMDVFSLALQKRAPKIILCYYRPTGALPASEEELDTTDRFVQVGLMVGINVVDCQIINKETFFSFEDSNLMQGLHKSSKYIPSFILREHIREQTEEILRRKEEENNRQLAAMYQQLTKKKEGNEQEDTKEDNAQQRLVRLLKNQGMDAKRIATITGLTVKGIERI